MNFWHQSFEPMSSIPGFQLTNLRFLKIRFVETIPAATNLQIHFSLGEFKNDRNTSKSSQSKLILIQTWIIS